MNTKYKVLSLLIALCCFFVGCEDDANSPTLSDSPVAAKITSFPDLTLLRANGDDVLTFGISPVEVGFNASVNYYLEACSSGNDFERSVVLYSGTNVDEVTLTNSKLNTLLLNVGEEDQAGNYDFRVRAILDADSGTGVDPHVLLSSVETKEATIYGLLRLDLIGLDGNQNIKSASSNGIYEGYVKLDADQPFTLTDPETGTTYGIAGEALVENGDSGFAPGESGWHYIVADINSGSLSFASTAYRYGLVGSATPNGWDAPDSKMDYDSDERCWVITIDLVDDQFKFRKNDGWAWNLGGKGSADGAEDNYDSDGMTVALEQGGRNLPLLGGAGNYTIKLYVEQSTAVIVKND